MDLIDVSTALEETEQVLRQCFEQFKLDEVFLSFNGGKDCTVLLDVTINVLQQIHQRDDIGKDLKVVYIRTKGPFREIEEFVEEIKDNYGVSLVVTEGEMKEALESILKEDGKLKACLMGTRRTDPYSEHLSFMQGTDPNWPQIVRVSPLLNWSYHQIWKYILQRRVSYCSLYDKGYTSIGSTHNTGPNPALATGDGYQPAWCLADAALERAGRASPSAKYTGPNGQPTTKHSGQPTLPQIIPNGLQNCNGDIDDSAKPKATSGQVNGHSHVNGADDKNVQHIH